MRKFAFVLWLFVTGHVLSFAQEGHEWETYYQQLSGTEDMESADWGELYQLLCELEEHPMNINAVTREDLEQLQCTALVTSGKFYNAQTSAQLYNGFNKSIDMLKNVEAKIILPDMK